MARKSRIKPIETGPFTNEIGQVVQPGDKVVVVIGSRSPGISVGRYIGFRKVYNGSTSVIVETDHERTKWVNEANEEFDYDKHVDVKRPGYYDQDYSRKYSAWWAEVQRVKKENFKEVKTPYVSRRVLQLNRVFKIDTSLANVKDVI